MKPMQLILLLSLNLPPCLVWAQDTLAERIRDAQLRAAALRAVEQSMAALEQRLSDPQTLSKALLAQPAEHRDRSASMSLLRAEERRKLRAAFAEQLILFARHLPSLPPDWAERVLREQSSHIDVVLRPLLDGRFAEHYAQARSLAIERQAQGIDEQEFYPSVHAVEALLDSELGLGSEIDKLSATPLSRLSSVLDGDAGQRLIGRHAEQIAAQRPLFEENHRLLPQRVHGAVVEQIAELQAQLSALLAYRPGGDESDSEAPSIAAADLEQAMLRRVRPSSGQRLFPALLKQAKVRAKRLEKNLLQGFISFQLDPQSGCSGLPAAQLSAAIGDDFRSVPSDEQSHFRQLHERFDGEIRQALLSDYAERLADPAARPAFLRHLHALIEQDRDLAGVFHSRLGDCLLGPLRQARSALAAAEVNARYPGLADGRFELDDADLQKLRGQHDFDAVALAGFPSDDGLHLQESQRWLADRRRQFKREGGFAIDSQFNLVAAHQAGFSERIRQDPDRKSRRDYWQQAFERRVLDEWQALRDADAATRDGVMLATDKYDRIFEPTARLIEAVLPVDWEVQQAAAQSSDPARRSVCEDDLALCRLAADVCYQAMADCVEDGDCSDALLRCRNAQLRCNDNM